MIFSTYFSLSGVVFAAAALATPPVLSPRVQHRSPRDVPSGWSLTRRADPDASIPLKFALKQSNLHNLEAYLLEIADPQSPNYGKHWTPAQVAETFRPSQDAVDTVHSWLMHEAGIDGDRIRIAHDSIHVDATAAEAENLLATEYYVYEHSRDRNERVGCHQGYSLPEHVSKHVDIVWPTVHFGGPTFSRRDSVSSRADKGGIHRPSGATKSIADDSVMQPGPTDCDKAVTLDCLRALYNFNYTLAVPDQNSVAVVEFGSNVFLGSDLDLFFKKFDPDQVGHRPVLASFAGGHLNKSASEEDLGESTMDFQLVMGLLGKSQAIYDYQVGKDNSDNNGGDELLGGLDKSYCSVAGVSALKLADCGDQPLAKVVSISYSTGADVYEDDVTPVLTRQCAEFGKLSLTGTTFVVSSGDSGVAFGSAGGCIVNGTFEDGNERGGFIPQFPASCPYVTTVGATQVSAGNSVYDKETATTDFPSGGGFSNNFLRPQFQNRAVIRYLKNPVVASYGADIFNRSGRAYPDVSANGFPTVVGIEGNFTLSGGTSASAPIFASLIAAINDARIAAGKSTVGWINPALYSHRFAGAFNDILNGTNPGCDSEGFPAARGWDPVTGLGTPNFAKLLSRFMALP